MRNLDSYVTVAERISAFYERYPEGSIQSEIVFDDGKRVVMRSMAYRKPGDATPSVGHAEEIRGDGPVNKTSALENCETSSAGRALAMLGFEVKQGIASREEVEQAKAEERRQAERPSHAEGSEANKLDAQNIAAMQALGFNSNKVNKTLDHYRTLAEKRQLQEKLQAEADGALAA